MGGGAGELLPLRKRGGGGRKKVLAMLKGGGGDVLPCPEVGGGGTKGFGPAIFPFCSPPPPRT